MKGTNGVALSKESRLHPVQITIQFCRFRVQLGLSLSGVERFVSSPN